MTMGRPRIYDAEVLATELNEYIDNTSDPMIEEYCLNTGVSKDTVYRLEKECQNLSDAIKRCHAKQQIRTVKRVEEGEMNPTWAIFKMKQPCYGWTDKQVIESENINHNLNDDVSELTEEELDKKIEELKNKNG